MTCDPLAAFAPDQSPLATQLVGALLTDHESVVLAPGTIGPGGVAAIVTIGISAGGVRASTVVVAELEPAAFEHLSV